MGLLDGKTILVTGVANRWSIASGIARQLHADGARLVLTYQGDRVEDAVRDHAKEHGDAAVFECDVTSDESLRALGERRQGRDQCEPETARGIARAGRAGQQTRRTAAPQARK